MSRFWNWLLSHLSMFRRARKNQSMLVQFQTRQRTQEEQLADARRRVEFLQDQTALRKGPERKQ